MVDQNVKGNHGNSVAFGDPHFISMQTIQYEKDVVRNYLVRLLKEFSRRDSILLSYYTG